MLFHAISQPVTPQADSRCQNLPWHQSCPWYSPCSPLQSSLPDLCPLHSGGSEQQVGLLSTLTCSWEALPPNLALSPPCPASCYALGPQLLQAALPDSLLRAASTAPCVNLQSPILESWFHLLLPHSPQTMRFPR